ncbi:MAG TPA: GYD domain superfamily, partial [bacterium]|nr:GYD domain superfamily [bacterium]
MGTFIMLSHLTENGAETLKKNPGRVQEVNKELEGMRVKVLAQY